MCWSRAHLDENGFGVRIEKVFHQARRLINDVPLANALVSNADFVFAETRTSPASPRLVSAVLVGCLPARPLLKDRVIKNRQVHAAAVCCSIFN
jgi:hypothetical protein